MLIIFVGLGLGLTLDIAGEVSSRVKSFWRNVFLFHRPASISVLKYECVMVHACNFFFKLFPIWIYEYKSSLLYITADLLLHFLQDKSKKQV